MKRTTLYLLLLLLAVIVLWYTNTAGSPEQVIVAAPPNETSAPVESAPPEPEPTASEAAEQPETIDRDGHYSSKEEVARYLFTFGELPSNYITKQAARDIGWVAEKGNLWEVTDKYSIGGDRFGNREKLLPEKSGRVYYECDIDYQGGRRGAKRIVFSNDGLVFYTDDHYESFEEIREGDL